MYEVEIKVCTRCIMDTTDTEISFDENGVCNHCRRYDELAPVYKYIPGKSDIAREKIVEKIKLAGKNKPYDCILGLSGGVDSSYAAYWVKKLGLRPLVVHFDNGWNSEISAQNIENIVKILGYDYQTLVVDWHEFKDLQLSFLKASVANAEAPTDQAFLAALYKLCAKHKIKYIISGANFATEGILPKSWGYDAKDLKLIEAIQKRFGTIKLKTYPKLGLLKELFYTYITGIRIVKILNFVPYIRKDAMKILESELGWKYYGGKHYESVFTKFFQAYILPTKFGYDKRKAHYSALICNGELTRNEALELMKEDLYPADQLRRDKEYMSKKFGISVQEFDQIIMLPKKSYQDYPNNAKIKNLIYQVYHKFKHSK